MSDVRENWDTQHVAWAWGGLAHCDNNVNQQILAAIKFGVSQNKVIWRLLNLASPRGPSMQCTIDIYVGGDKY